MSTRSEIRFLAVALALALAIGIVPAAAQERPSVEPPQADAAAQSGGETNAEEEAVEPPGISENIKESQPPAPNEQGMLQTESLDEDQGEAEKGQDLYTLLIHLRRAPPNLEGEPVPRPNLLASEPETEMVPLQPREAYLFHENYIE